MITITYPTQLPALHKLVDRICRKNSAEILFTLLNSEGYQLVTTIDPSKEEEVIHALFRYSSLFQLSEIDS